MSARISTANVYDNQEYQNLVEHLPDTVQYVVADAGYDDWKLYDYSRYRGIRLVCPEDGTSIQKVRDWESFHFTNPEKVGRYNRNRDVSIEPLFCTVKETFGMDPSPVRGFDNVSSYLLMCVLVYQIVVYWNSITGNVNPRYIKRMHGN